MALDFEGPLDQIFGALGSEVTYIAANGDQKTVLAIPKQPDIVYEGQYQTQLQTSTLTLEILRSDIEAFTKGADKIVLGGDTYIVQNAKIKDSLKLVWLVDTYPEGDA